MKDSQTESAVGQRHLNYNLASSYFKCKVLSHWTCDACVLYLETCARSYKVQHPMLHKITTIRRPSDCCNFASA